LKIREHSSNHRHTLRTLKGRTYELQPLKKEQARSTNPMGREKIELLETSRLAKGEAEALVTRGGGIEAAHGSLTDKGTDGT